MVTINRARFCLLSPLFIDPQREYSLVTKYGLQSQPAIWVCVCVLSHVPLFASPCTVPQVPLSVEFPGENPGASCQFLLQGIFLIHGLDPSPACPALAGGFFTTEPGG